MSEPSGAQWCARYPGSSEISDLAEPFRTHVTYFVGALRDAGASVTISATYRPPERAHLMHYCCLVAGYRDNDQVFHQMSAPDVPAYPGVDIDWTHGGDGGAARASAVQMVKGYGSAFPAALASNHTRRLAIDMTIHFQGAISVRDAAGNRRSAASQSDLWPIGASYGVIKLPSDAPHWGADGH